MLIVKLKSFPFNFLVLCLNFEFLVISLNINGKYQVVALKVECIYNFWLKVLCLTFFTQSFSFVLFWFEFWIFWHFGLDGYLLNGQFLVISLNIGKFLDGSLNIVGKFLDGCTYSWVYFITFYLGLSFWLKVSIL